MIISTLLVLFIIKVSKKAIFTTPINVFFLRVPEILVGIPFTVMIQFSRVLVLKMLLHLPQQTAEVWTRAKDAFSTAAQETSTVETSEWEKIQRQTS